MAHYLRFEVRLKQSNPLHPEVRVAWAHVVVLGIAPDAHILAATKLESEGYLPVRLLDVRRISDQGLATLPQTIRDEISVHPSERVHIEVHAYNDEQPSNLDDPFRDDFSNN
ncbi:MAG: hypothetical protein HOP33_00140 [Verrucomicrobia bacterium]|nr:hypothetical protein [Verrucomicrobiota bacterium]